jgi:hypothetical protein
MSRATTYRAEPTAVKAGAKQFNTPHLSNLCTTVVVLVLHMIIISITTDSLHQVTNTSELC